MKTYTTDVLVIGAGGAGLRAAIAAADSNADVIVVGKTLLGKAHTVMAEGGINAALGNLDPQDSWKVHFADTMKEGQFINDWKAVEIMVKEAPAVVLELEQYGVLFDRTPDGKIMQRAFGGHTYRRTCHIADRTGLEIMQVLMAECMKRKRITSVEEVILTKVVKNNNKVIGAVGISLQTGDITVITCKAAILATGGHARVYKRSTNAWETVGDGYALALDAGAELQDMEMVQFHPTGMTYPEVIAGMLVTESVRGEGGVLTNANGERFMKRYDPVRMELSTRDIVARAIFNEIKEGRGTKHKGVWLDISHKPRTFIEKKLPKMIDKFREFAGTDITKEKMEVAPTAHYSMGGIKVDPETCATKIHGLYAAGEATAGVHGANRLGGNSLVDILVFGKHAGIAAAKYAKTKKVEQVPVRLVAREEKRLLAPLAKKKGIRPIILKEKIQEVMWKNVGVVRSIKSLKKALQEIQQIKRKTKALNVSGSRIYNHEWAQYLDVCAMVLTCEAIIRSTLARKESRGAHYLIDYPQTSNQWLKNVIVNMQKEKLYIRTCPVPKMPNHLKRLV